jgi:C-terminal processing protease CtpA/Prc
VSGTPRGWFDASQSAADSADALILDMRSNTGGSPDTAALILSYLFDKPGIELFQVIPRSGTLIRFATLEVPEADRNGSRPVFVLTASRTFLAGEGFAYLLQDRKRGEVVGERTADEERRSTCYFSHNRLVNTAAPAAVSSVPSRR